MNGALCQSGGEARKIVVGARQADIVRHDGDQRRAGRDAIGCSRRVKQSLLGCARWQPVRGLCEQQRRDRPWRRIDAGRKIESCFGLAAELGHRIKEVAAMLRAITVPSIRIARERGLAIVCLVFALATMFAATASARQPRIASINVCTDQLLLALADPEQILGLSPYSRDGTRSWAAAEASKYRKLSGDRKSVV